MKGFGSAHSRAFRSSLFIVYALFLYVLGSSAPLCARGEKYSLSEIRSSLKELEENPVLQYTESLLTNMQQELVKNGTGAWVDFMHRVSNELSSEAIPFSINDIRGLIFSITKNKPVTLPLSRPLAQVEEVNKRLARQGIDFLLYEQDPAYPVAEKARTFLNAKLDHFAVAAFEDLEKSTNTATLVDGPTIVRIPGISQEEFAALALKLKALQSKKAIGPEYQVLHTLGAHEVVVDASQPLPEHEKSMQRLGTVRIGYALLSPLAINPGLELYNQGAISGGTVGSSMASSVLEYQFVRKLLGFGGTEFWTRAIAKHPRLPVLLNLLYPAICLTAGMAGNLVRGEEIKPSFGDWVVHPLLSAVTFGLLSFGYAQAQFAQQLEKGYASKYVQFKKESYALFFLNTMRLVGVGASFFASRTVFEALGANFSIGHLIAYSAQLGFAATVSAGLMMHNASKRIEDDILEDRFIGRPEPGKCKKMLVSLGRKFRLGYR